MIKTKIKRTPQAIGKANKQKGSRRERQVKKMLEDTGYLVVKSGASLGLFDLIALGDKQCRLIQVKSNWCSPAEREGIEEFDAPSYCTKELWVYKDRVKEPIITKYK